MEESPEQGSVNIRGRVMTYRQKWVAGILAPLTILVLGWAGSWVGYTMSTGATANTRISVAESRIGQLEEGQRGIMSILREDHDLLLEIRGHIISTQQIPAQLERLSRRLDRAGVNRSEVLRDSPHPPALVCKDSELLVRAANGETFCRAR